MINIYISTREIIDICFSISKTSTIVFRLERTEYNFSDKKDGVFFCFIEEESIKPVCNKQKFYVNITYD